MNAITPIIATQQDCWLEAQRQANEWRGHLVQRFARAEAAISETLLTLSRDPKIGDRIRLQHLTGQRFQDLGSAIAPDGPFASIGAVACAPLAALRNHHETWRPFLCHGCGRIARDRKGGWLLILDLLVFQSGKPDRRTRVVAEAEAQPLLDDVGKTVHRLVNALTKVRQAVAAT